MATSFGNTLQYSCLENPLSDRGAWQATVYRVAKRQDQNDPVSINTRLFFFACGSSDPVRVERKGGAAAWLAGTLAAPSVQGLRLPLQQELWPYQSPFLSLAIRRPFWPVFLRGSAHTGT